MSRRKKKDFQKVTVHLPRELFILVDQGAYELTDGNVSLYIRNLLADVHKAPVIPKG